jgi:hypothetical protein
MDKFTDDTTVSPQPNQITQYLVNQNGAVQDSREESRIAEEELRADVEVPDLGEARRSYLESLEAPEVKADTPQTGPRDIELTADDDFLPYLHDVEKSYDLTEQAYQDKNNGVKRNPGEVSNEFLLPGRKTIMGIDVATDQRIMNRGDQGNKQSQEAYADGIKKVRESTFNVNEGYDLNGLSGFSDIARGIQDEGGTRADFERAINLMGVPPEQAKLAWNAETARRAQEDIAERLQGLEAVQPDEAPPPPDIEAEELPNVEGWRDAASLVYEREEGQAFSGSDEELVDWYVGEMSSFNWKIGIPRGVGLEDGLGIDVGINDEGMAYYMVRAMQEDEAYAKALVQMIDTYERVKYSPSIIAQNIGQILTDPVNLIGLGGGAVAMKVGGHVAKNAMKNWLVKGAVAGGGAGAVEGPIWAGGAEAMMQQVEKEAGYRDKFQVFPDETGPGIGGAAAAGAIVGPALGAALGVGLPLAAAGTRRAARHMRDNARSGRRLGPMRKQIGAINPGAVEPLKYKGDVDVDPEAPTYDNAVKAAATTHYPNQKAFKEDLQAAANASMKKHGVDLKEDSPEATRILTNQLIKDTRIALANNANAVGWYNETIGATMSILEEIHPELATDPHAKFAFTYALANTSNGLKVDKNFKLAEEAYRHYKETGEMPRNGVGNAASAINKTAELFKTLKDDIGLDKMIQVFDDTFTVKQLKLLGYDVSGENADTVVRGAAMMGPKIGNGFYANLRGHFDQLTMDRWFIRTWGRHTGTLIVNRPDMVRQKTTDLRDVAIKVKADPDLVKAWKAIGVNPNERSMTRLSQAIQKSSMLPANREVMNATTAGEKMRTLGNSLAGYIDGQKEDPANGKERTRIRKIMQGVLNNIKGEYPDLSMSDLQAVLWYAEKRLYDSARASDEVGAGYADDEAPDYANAAAALARELGLTDKQIKEADSNGRARATERSAAGAGPEEGGPADQGQSGGGAGRQRSKYLLDKVYAPHRPSGGGDGKASRSYSRGSRGDDRVSRGIAATYKPKKAFSNLLANSEVPSPTLVELVPEKAPDFHKAITQSKNKGRFGASVYVYSPEEYANMRLFQTEDGTAGLALKQDEDGVDIVSGYSSGGGNIYSLLQLAVEEGGTKLDAFDTVLPEIYSRAGFVEVDRVQWNEEFKPDGWDKEVFKRFNGGEPDIVFMRYQPEGEE